MTDNTVNAFPSKSFFVDMIIRDIELNAAILDLIDNCIDGVSRVEKASNNGINYNNYYAKLELSEDHFKLTDNCGGIPLEVAKKYAFRLGRDPNYTDDNDIKTIGMYGIGMKRALFKIGQESSVSTRTDFNQYKVTVPRDWALSESWEFPFENLDSIDSLEHNGTVIESVNLTSSAQQNFSSSSFISDLKNEIKKHFSYILAKGFKISLNGEDITPLSINFLVKPTNGVEPFYYKGEIDNVEVSIICGFIGPPLKDSEEEAEIETGNKSENAGWTIICNDRVVLYKDKTRLTGWGEDPVPQYHTQFINISGIVRFSSDHAEKLPLTTTKRGVDNNSELYMYARGIMKEATKIFTDVTNKIKKDYARNKTALFESTTTFSEQEVDSHYASKASNVSNKKKFSETSKETKFRPKIKVIDESKSDLFLRFSRTKTEIKIVAKYLKMDPEPPGKVAEEAFNQIYLIARRQNEQ